MHLCRTVECIPSGLHLLRHCLSVFSINLIQSNCPPPPPPPPGYVSLVGGWRRQGDAVEATLGDRGPPATGHV